MQVEWQVEITVAYQDHRLQVVVDELGVMRHLDSQRLFLGAF